MIITPDLFEAYLKCPTKCLLLSFGERGTANAYAEWVRVQEESYRSEAIKRLRDGVPDNEFLISPPATANPKAAKWRMAAAFTACGRNLASCLHAVERVPSECVGRPARFLPIRFVPKGKLSKNDKLLLAFDALALSEAIGCEVSVGKINHGHYRTTVNVNTCALAGEVRKVIEKIATLVSHDSARDHVLNRHCAECEFQTRCRQKAVEADDLSLLSGLTWKERARHRSKGIFTVTQLSYTFSPRRAPKRAKNPATPHYFALQALAIRENTVYIHGSPQLPESKTRVYLDIEGLPDRDFYYLIGALVVTGGQESFHSFWADGRSAETATFSRLLDLVARLQDYRVFHFGNYETTALKRLRLRLPNHLHAAIDALLDRSTNVLSLVSPQIYFPTYSNSLKEIGPFLGHARQSPIATGSESTIWRCAWEKDRSEDTRKALLLYNEEDCYALKRLCDFIDRLNLPTRSDGTPGEMQPRTSSTEELRKDSPRWGTFGAREYALDDFEQVSKCAYFDYQRERIFVRTDRKFRAVNKRRPKLRRTNLRPNRKVDIAARKCRHCKAREIEPRQRSCHFVLDLRFTRSGVKKWITRTTFSRYICLKCGRQFSSRRGAANPPRYGHELVSWCLYWNLARGLNMSRVRRGLGDLFGLYIPQAAVHRFKGQMMALYESMYAEILQGLLGGTIIHVDETAVNLRGKKGYVWVMASMDKVYYFYRPSREGAFLDEMLASFHGVLISDFFTAYDTLPCQQQKCLVHLVRDINEDLLRNPLDSPLRSIAQDFGMLLRAIVGSVDRYGLKRRHLQKHKEDALCFLKSVASRDDSSELAMKYKKRFEKSGLKMFTFLDHDGVPWNNTNAEHAIKQFAKFRRDANGRFTESSLSEYLVLASVFETCEFNNVNVLTFLLSKETTLGGLLRMAGR